MGVTKTTDLPYYDRPMLVSYTALSTYLNMPIGYESMIVDTQGCARDLLSRDRDETRDSCLRDRNV